MNTKMNYSRYFLIGLLVHTFALPSMKKPALSSKLEGTGTQTVPQSKPSRIPYHDPQNRKPDVAQTEVYTSVVSLLAIDAPTQIVATVKLAPIPEHPLQKAFKRDRAEYHKWHAAQERNLDTVEELESSVKIITTLIQDPQKQRDAYTKNAQPLRQAVAHKKLQNFNAYVASMIDRDELKIVVGIKKELDALAQKEAFEFTVANVDDVNAGFQKKAADLIDKAHEEFVAQKTLKEKAEAELAQQAEAHARAVAAANAAAYAQHAQQVALMHYAQLQMQQAYPTAQPQSQFQAASWQPYFDPTTQQVVHLNLAAAPGTQLMIPPHLIPVMIMPAAPQQQQPFAPMVYQPPLAMQQHPYPPNN